MKWQIKNRCIYTVRAELLRFSLFFPCCGAHRWCHRPVPRSDGVTRPFTHDNDNDGLIADCVVLETAKLGWGDAAQQVATLAASSSKSTDKLQEHTDRATHSTNPYLPRVATWWWRREPEGEKKQTKSDQGDQTNETNWWRNMKHQGSHGGIETVAVKRKNYLLLWFINMQWGDWHRFLPIISTSHCQHQ